MTKVHGFLFFFFPGFLSQYIQKKSIAESVKCGHYAAAAIIRQEGCSLPSTCLYHWNSSLSFKTWNYLCTDHFRYLFMRIFLQDQDRIKLNVTLLLSPYYYCKQNQNIAVPLLKLRILVFFCFMFFFLFFLQ